MLPPDSSLRTKAPVFVVLLTGSFQTMFSLNRNCTSAKLPRSILIPDSFNVTPVPASPELRTRILSLIVTSVELTVVVVPLTTRFPVTCTSPTARPVSSLITPASATLIE